jgi:NAD(P)H-dependent FMN reductase
MSDTGNAHPGRPLRLAVIIGSTREGRAGEAVARWVAALAGRRGDLEVDVLDLAEFDLPARYLSTVPPPVAAFTGRLDRADAFVIVTPEYNHSFPASLKQALDFGYDEWRAKPVGFVAYGHGSEGVYAVEHLRAVCTELHMATVRDRVAVDLLDPGVRDGLPDGDARPAREATAMLDQLAWWGAALRDARARRPYVS